MEVSLLKGNVVGLSKGKRRVSEAKGEKNLTSFEQDARPARKKSAGEKLPNPLQERPRRKLEPCQFHVRREKSASLKENKRKEDFRARGGNCYLSEKRTSPATTKKKKRKKNARYRNRKRKVRSRQEGKGGELDRCTERAVVTKLSKKP